MDPVTALTACGGAARWARLRSLGVTDGKLRAATHSGAVLAIGHGAFALASAPAALTTAVRFGGVASHVTAATLQNYATWNSYDELHVTIPRGGSREREVGVVLHRATLQPCDMEYRRACTSLLRTAVDCARTLPLLDGVCVLDSALRSAAVTEGQLFEAIGRTRGPGATRARQALEWADKLAGSALESVLRLFLGLTGGRIRSQVYIPGVGTVDFLIDEWLVVEGDGFSFHSDRKAYRDDRARGNEITARGLGQLRFTWEDAQNRPLWIVAQVERTRRLRLPE